MKLSELATLREAANEPVEIAALAAGFPKAGPKAISQMLSKNRLLFNTRPFEDVYSDAVEKAESVEVSLNIEIPLTDVDALEKLDAADWDNFSADIEIDSAEEVYGGWSPKSPNCLYIGFDAWGNEDDFNEMFDRAFNRETGEHYDHEDPRHEAIFQPLYKKFSKMSKSAYLVKVTINAKGLPTAAEVVISPDDLTVPGIFYQAMYRDSSFKELNLIDLRLD